MHLKKPALWLLTLAGCLLAAAADAANWPRFRGPNGAGVADDKDIPVEWTDKNFLWKARLPGPGNSSPVVWGDRIFLQCSAADAKARFMVCLDAKDGQVVWKQELPGSKAVTHQKNTHASGTPATDGERVYAAFWDGKDLALVAFDFAGKQLWKRDLGPFKSQHGAGHSPVVYEDKVILANDQDDSAVLLAFDAKTGKDAWSVKRTPFRTCYSTPFVLEKPNAAPELIVASTAGITAYDPKTGAEAWKFTWKFDNMPLRTVGSPIYHQGLIFACSGDGKGDRHAIAVKADGNKGDVSASNLVWENKKVLPYVPCLLAKGEHLYYVNDKGVAACVVAKTGAEVWSERLGGGVSASPVLIDGKVYVASEDGDVYVFAAEPTFKLLAKNSLGERVIASPAVADGRLLIRGGNHLFCIGQAK